MNDITRHHQLHMLTYNSIKATSLETLLEEYLRPDCPWSKEDLTKRYSIIMASSNNLRNVIVANKQPEKD